MLALLDRATTLPMSTPYLITVSPTLKSFKGDLVGRSEYRSSVPPDRGVGLHDPASSLAALGAAFHDDDADAIAPFMHKQNESSFSSHAGRGTAIRPREAISAATSLF